MRAVAADYLDYKDCELSGKELDTLEAWSISRVKRQEAQYLREVQLGILGSTLHLGGDSEDRISAIQELWSGTTEAIIGTSQKVESQSLDAKYREVFGDVTEEDIAELNQYLEDETLVNKQEDEFKKQALVNLDLELQRKAERRLR